MNTSRFAIAAAASVLATNAMAADLGGNCCADLEERVAELEATTARKGNRRVSLTVSGHVNEGLLWWDDGKDKNAYIVTNENSRSRFRFVGDAKISADWSAGFLLEVGVRTSNSSNISQLGDDFVPTNTSLDLRHSAWWIENSKLGRIWVGLTSQATDGIAEINLSNAAVSAGPDILNWGGGLFLRAKDRRFGTNGLLVVGSSNPAAPRATPATTPPALGAPFGVNLAAVLPQTGSVSDVGDGDRRNIIKYVSPNFFGFNFQSSWGEDHEWDVALRYANEFNGLRVAGGVGWQQWNDGLGRAFPSVGEVVGNTGTLFTSGTGIPTGSQGDRMCGNLAFADGEQRQRAARVSCGALGTSASLLHVPTGLFIYGGYGFINDDFRQELFFARSGGVFPNANDRDQFWNIQAGIEKNWLGIGKTDFYGEYGIYSQGAGILTSSVGNGNANNLNNVFFNLFAPNNVPFSSVFITSSDVRMWGFGTVQSIDAAAMDLYLGFRNFSTDLNIISIERARLTGPALTTTFRSIAVDDIQQVFAGGIIRF